MTVEVMVTLQICENRCVYIRLFIFWTLDILLYSGNSSMFCFPCTTAWYHFWPTYWPRTCEQLTSETFVETSH